MDHRWDEMLHAEHRRRLEQGRYDREAIERDEDVLRRDELEASARARRANRSPWEIGAAHWDQRDLYTRNDRTDAGGYARGPSYHPEEGSYAYRRDPALLDDRRASTPPSRAAGPRPNRYERQAWPWLNYERVEPDRTGGTLWGRVKRQAATLAGKLTGNRDHDADAEARSRTWRRADVAVYDDVIEVLGYSHALDARGIEVEVMASEVTLRGTVPSRPQKRLAEELVERVHGVRDVHNRLSIRKDDDDMAFTSPIAASY